MYTYLYLLLMMMMIKMMATSEESLVKMYHCNIVR